MKTYRSQNCVHELVQVAGVHQSSTLKNAHGQLGYHGQMALKVMTDDFAQLVVVLERLDLLDLPKGIKGVVVQIVDFVNVTIRNDDVW